MKKYLVSILLILIGFVGFSQTYDPTKATVSNKPYGMAQAFPTDARTFFYDATNFLWRPYQSTAEVKTYLNLAKYRAGNFLIIVDSGGTLNSNGTYTGGVNNFWMFKDGVLDANLVELFLQGGGGGSGCSTCFFTTTQLTDTSFKLNRPNLTSDTVVVDFITGVYISTLNNGLNLVGTNGQLGGPLVKNTVLNGGGFDFAVSGNTFQQGQGAAIASANVVTTGHDGNAFSVIGSTQINAITTTNWQAGSQISFIFTGTPLLRNNQVAPAGSAPLLLAGGVDYAAATNDVITFLYDGAFWHETSRKLAGAVIPVTANNAITLSGSLLQWGGTLIKPTTVAGNLFPTFFSGGRVEMPMGLPVIAAGDLFVGNDGNFFQITGTTQINAIGTTNWQAGSEISFYFNSIVTLKNNTAGGINTAPMFLAGGLDYTSAVGDYIGFIFDGTFWRETNRKLAGSVTSVTASNGLTLTGTNITLGGTLTNNTTIAQSTFRMIWTGAVATGPLSQFTQTDNGGGVNILNTGTGTSLNVSTNNTGTGINVATTSTGYGIVVNSTSTTNAGITSQTPFQGIQGNTTSTGTNAAGVVGGSTASGSPGILSIVTVGSTGSVIPTMFANRLSSGTAANGIGQSFDFNTQTDAGGVALSNQIISKWTTVTNATRTSQLSFTGVNSGTTNVLATIDGTGNMVLNGTGTALTATSASLGAFLVGSVAGMLTESPSIPIQAANTSTSTNTVVVTYLSSRQGSTYIGAIGSGTKISFDAHDNVGSINGSGDITNKLTNVSSGAITSQFDFNTIVSGATILKLSIGGNATFMGSTRFETTRGNGVASTGNLTLGTDGNVFHITGTTTINAITTADWQAGSVFSLIFDASLTVKNNTAGGAGTAVMLLAGGADFSATANDVLTLIWDGTSFFEKSRSVN